MLGMRVRLACGLGHAAALTTIQVVIHYRVAANATPKRGEKKQKAQSLATALFNIHTIFSCLTFLSITCREASSATMSSTEIPISTASTVR